MGKRTWFVSLTMSPDEHFRCIATARERLRARSVSWDKLSKDAQFREHTAEFGRAVTLWVKRLREATKVPFRYMLVFEQHTKPHADAGVTVEGYPHAHLLIHETSDLFLLRKRQLQGQWTHGFSAVKLADTETASYVTKYLTKTAPCRIRASVGYGLGIRPKSHSRVVRPKTGRANGVPPPNGYDLPLVGWGEPQASPTPLPAAVNPTRDESPESH